MILKWVAMTPPPAYDAGTSPFEWGGKLQAPK